MADYQDIDSRTLEYMHRLTRATRQYFDPDVNLPQYLNNRYYTYIRGFLGSILGDEWIKENIPTRRTPHLREFVRRTIEDVTGITGSPDDEYVNVFIEEEGIEVPIPKKLADRVLSDRISEPSTIPRPEPMETYEEYLDRIRAEAEIEPLEAIPVPEIIEPQEGYDWIEYEYEGKATATYTRAHRNTEPTLSMEGIFLFTQRGIPVPLAEDASEMVEMLKAAALSEWKTIKNFSNKKGSWNFSNEPDFGGNTPTPTGKAFRTHQDPVLKQAVFQWEGYIDSEYYYNPSYQRVTTGTRGRTREKFTVFFPEGKPPRHMREDALGRAVF